MEAAAAAPARAAAKPVRLTDEQLRIQRERESLELSRTRVRRDLETARNPRYRDQLRAALQHLDERLKSLSSV